MTDAQKIKTLTQALEDIRRVQSNSPYIYRDAEVGQLKVINGIASSALTQSKKK